MSSLTSPFAAKSSENIAEPTRMKVLQEAAVTAAPSPASDFYDQQIQALVQQVFFQPSATPVRHIGIASVEPDTETAQLCLEVGLALAALGPHDVGLVDVRLQAPPLHTQLKIAGDQDTDESRQIGPNLWLAPRRSWLDDSPQGMWDHSLGRLRATTLEFAECHYGCVPDSATLLLGTVWPSHDLHPEWRQDGSQGAAQTPA